MTLEFGSDQMEGYINGENDQMEKYITETGLKLSPFFMYKLWILEWHIQERME